MPRLLLLAMLAAATLSAQLPRSFYVWWNKPEIVRNLKLTPVQREQIRGAVQEFRPHLLNVRSEVNQAEQALTEQFDRSPVNPGKTNKAIERLVDARSDLTRTLSQLSLKLRLILTEEQWQELQRRRPQKQNEPAPEPDEQK